MNKGRVGPIILVTALLSSVAFAAGDPRTINLNEDGLYEGFTPYAANLKGVAFFYASCHKEDQTTSLSQRRR